jgi:hypothetical protein
MSTWRGLLSCGFLLLLPWTAHAEYVFGLSPVAALDGLDPQLNYTLYPPDTLDLEGAGEVGFNLADLIAGELQIRLSLRDRQEAETVLLEGTLSLGTHQQAFLAEPGDWRLVLRAEDGFGNTAQIVGSEFFVRSTSIDAATRPAQLALSGITPNPFNPRTTLHFAMPLPGPVFLVVYNLQGQVVQTLVDGPLPAGLHQAVFDGADLPSGMYLARLTAAGRSVTAKLTLLK